MRILIILSLVLCIGTHKSNAVKCSLKLKENGEYSEIDLPFAYYNRPTHFQKFDYIPQGSYGKYVRDKNVGTTVLIGPLNPCVGVIAANRNQVIAFHIHWSNDLNDMNEKIRKCFDSKMDSFHARIFTAADSLSEWKDRQDDIAHNAKTQKDFVKKVKDFLITSGIPKNHILAEVFNLTDKEGKLWYSSKDLGVYAYAQQWIALNLEEITCNTPITTTGPRPQKSIPLYSIDPVAEDIYNLKNQFFTPRDIWGNDLPLETKIQQQTAMEKCMFSNLPLDLKREIYFNKLHEKENSLYKIYFKVEDPNVLFTVKKDTTIKKLQNSLAFMPIDDGY